MKSKLIIPLLFLLLFLTVVGAWTINSWTTPPAYQIQNTTSVTFTINVTDIPYATVNCSVWNATNRSRTAWTENKLGAFSNNTLNTTTITFPDESRQYIKVGCYDREGSDSVTSNETVTLPSNITADATINLAFDDYGINIVTEGWVNDTGSSYRLLVLNSDYNITSSALLLMNTSIEGNTSLWTYTYPGTTLKRNATNESVRIIDIDADYWDFLNISLGVHIAGNLIVDGNVTASNVHLPSYVGAHTNVTMNVSSAGVWYNVTFNEEVSTPKKDITHTYNDATNDSFIIGTTGIYALTYTMIFEDSASSPSANIVTRIVNNGTEIGGSLLEIDTSKQNNEVQSAHSAILISLTNGDVIKFQFTSDDTTVQLKAHATYGTHKDTAVITIYRID